MLLHGNPIPGNLLIGDPLVGEPGRRGELLAGPDLGVGCAEQDLGWVLGWVFELELGSRDGPFRRDGYPGCRDAVLRSYPHPYSTDRVRMATAVRVLAHAADFARFHGWRRDELAAHVDLAAALCDGADSTDLFVRGPNG